MKRFILFAGDEFYPCGGWSDLISDHDTAVEAMAALHALAIYTACGQWAHIVDTSTGDVTDFMARLAKEWEDGDKGQPWTERTRREAAEDSE